MRRIFGWPASESLTDGCSYYRVEVPFSRLRAEGLDVTWRRQIQEADVQMADVLYGQRIADPAVSPFWSAWASRRTSGFGPKLVADLDDDLLNVPEWSPVYDLYQDPDVRNTIMTGVALADRVTVSTQPLADSLRKYNDQVVVVPNAIPTWLLDHQRPRRERLTIGWAGSDSHAGDWLNEGSAWHWGDKVGFHMIGGDPKWFAHRDPKSDFRHTEWVWGVDSYLSTIDFDLCVIPLAPHVFNLSKSGIKAMEMAALGIPVVAQHCAAYEKVVYHGVTGFLVSGPDEMAWRLSQLVQDRELREEMGSSAREHARKNFTIDQTWRQWELALTL